jgi:hypothetical protein
LLKQENKKGSAKELPVLMVKMADSVRRGRGFGFGCEEVARFSRMVYGVIHHPLLSMNKVKVRVR